MAGETTITIVGNISQDVELRFTPAGAAVANFSVASTPKVFDRNSNEWKDAETLFMRCSAWREMAENIAESITKGTRVVVTGRLKQRSYETTSGEKRTVIELEVDEIGPSLRWATAKVTRAARNGNSGGFAGNAGQSGQGGGWGGQQGTQQPAGGDPWANPAATANAGGWGGANDEPAF